MGAEWFYDGDVNVIVFELWSRGSRAVQAGKRFMPTLSMYNNMKNLKGGSVPTGLDELKAHDETGRYAVEGGRLVIPLRVADDEDRGGFFRRWKAQVRDLTTGLEADVSFSHSNCGAGRHLVKSSPI